mgnify:CR=1 FL=1
MSLRMFETLAKPPESRRRNHGGIVRGEGHRRHEHRNTRGVPALLGVGAQAAVGRHAARRYRRCVPGMQRAASNSRSSSVSTTTRWKLAQMSMVSRSGSGSRGVRSRANRRAVTWRNTDVFNPLKLKSRVPGRSGALRSACVSRMRGNGDRTIVAAARRDRRSQGHRDTRDAAAWRPCRMPHLPHRRGYVREVRTSRAW